MFRYIILYVFACVDVSLLVSLRQTPISSCQDINTNACQLFYDKDPGICNTTFKDQNCQRFCGNCPRECYFCEDPVFDPTDCNTTKKCAPNMYCMTKTLVKTDGLREYIMTCEEKKSCRTKFDKTGPCRSKCSICDGLAVGFHLGKRELMQEGEDNMLAQKGKRTLRDKRYLAFECCDTDFCNMPSKS